MLILKQKRTGKTKKINGFESLYSDTIGEKEMLIINTENERLEFNLRYWNILEDKKKKSRRN